MMLGVCNGTAEAIAGILVAISCNGTTKAGAVVSY